MQKDINRLLKKCKKDTEKWAYSNFFSIFIINLILLILFLLHSAGYFDPYFPITVNFVIIVGIFVATILLNLNIQILIVMAGAFWLFAGLLYLLRVNIWAYRTTLYVFQIFVLMIVLLLYQSLRSHKAKKS